MEQIGFIGTFDKKDLLLNIANVLALNGKKVLIVDAYKMQGSKLYAIKYVEPGIQDAAESTYIPSSETLQLIQNDPNIVQTAKNELIQYYNANYPNYRPGIQNALNAEDDATKKSLSQAGTSSETTTLSSQRQQYLQSMGE